MRSYEKKRGIGRSRVSPRLRGRLLARTGKSVHAWALANGFPPSSVYSALSGARNGPVAIAIRRALLSAGVDLDQP